MAIPFGTVAGGERLVAVADDGDECSGVGGVGGDDYGSGILCVAVLPMCEFVAGCGCCFDGYCGTFFKGAAAGDSAHVGGFGGNCNGVGGEGLCCELDVVDVEIVAVIGGVVDGDVVGVGGYGDVHGVPGADV